MILTINVICRSFRMTIHLAGQGKGNIKLMGGAVSSEYIQLQSTMKQTSPKIKSSEFNQPVKLNTMLKYVLAHTILLVILIFNQGLYCCDYILSYDPDSHIRW